MSPIEGPLRSRSKRNVPAGSKHACGDNRQRSGSHQRAEYRGNQKQQDSEPDIGDQEDSGVERDIQLRTHTYRYDPQG